MVKVSGLVEIGTVRVKSWVMPSQCLHRDSSTRICVYTPIFLAHTLPPTTLTFRISHSFLFETISFYFHLFPFISPSVSLFINCLPFPFFHFDTVKKRNSSLILLPIQAPLLSPPPPSPNPPGPCYGVAHANDR